MKELTEVALSQPPPARFFGGGFDALRSQPGSTAQSPTLPALDEFFSRLVDVISEVSGVLENSAVAAEIRIRSAGDLLRNCPAKVLAAAGDPVKPPPSGSARGALSAWQVRRVTDYIESHLNETITVEDLSTVARLSPAHFSRAFRARLNVPPHGFIVQRRVDRSQQLMKSTDAPLVSIATECGFADQAHFNRVYRKLVGVTPGIWRRMQLSVSL